MKKIFLCFLFLYSSFAFSVDVYNEHSSNVSALWRNGYSTITINSKSVRQYPVDSRNCKTNYCAYKGTLNDEDLLLGDNNIKFYVSQTACYANTPEINDSFNHYAINRNNKRIVFFDNLKRRGKCPAKFDRSTTVNISLSELDYQLYLDVNNAISTQNTKLNEFKVNYQGIESEIARESANLDALENTINECFQAASVASDLSSLEKQFSKCENFKKSYDNLNALIKSKELVSEEARDGFNDGLKNFGNTISDFKYQGKSVLSKESVAEIEKSILDQMPLMREERDGRVNFISQFASKISDRLESLFAEGKRGEFIKLAEFAEEKLNEFSAEVAAKNYPYAETQSLDMATRSVNKTLEKYVDKNFWFNDALVPQETKDAIDNVLAKVDKKTSLELKAALQQQNKTKGEALRKGITDALSFFSVLDSVKADSNSKVIDSFISRTAGQFVTFIKNEGLCLGARVALNDAADLFELVSGRDFCNVDRELSLSERAFSGLGLVVGSGEMWSKVAKKSSGVLSEVTSSMSNFFRKTSKGGLKTEEEILEYAQVIRSSQNEEHMAKALFDSASEEAIAIRRFGPINPGPLHEIKSCHGCTESVADTFRSSSYFKVALDEDLILYRVQTKGAGKLGAFWSRIKPGTKLSSKIDSALLDEWGNAANSIVTIKIPKNSSLEIFEGIAGEQLSKTEKLLGGGSQVFIKLDDLSLLDAFKI